MIRLLRQLFCKHKYELLGYHSNYYRGRQEFTYIKLLCKKCDHLVETKK